MSSLRFKPNDLVRTPCGRTALVDDLAADGRRELHYVDGDRSKLALRPEQLTLVASAPAVHWTRYRL